MDQPKKETGASHKAKIDMGIEERKLREKQLRYDSILAAAKKVFLAKGFKGATIEQISWEAELSPGTVYLYFKNKEELHTLLSIEILETLSRRILEIYARTELTPIAKLLALKGLFIEIYEEDPKILINLFHLQSGEPLEKLSDEILLVIKSTSSKSLGALVSIVQEGMDQGFFIPQHPVAVADIIWATYSGIVLWVDSKRMLNKQKDFVKQTLETSFRVLIRGLKYK